MKVTMRKGGNKMTNFHINGHYHIVEMLPFIFHHKEITFNILFMHFRELLVPSLLANWFKFFPEKLSEFFSKMSDILQF